MSRHQISVATPLSPLQVATSKRGRDTVSPAQPPSHVATSNRCRDTTRAYPGRDTKIRSRPLWRLPYVATSNSCRDTVSAHSGPSRSRHQNSMSRPPTLPPMSRHHIHVATPFLPNQSRPGRDFISWSRPHAQPRPNQVATSNLGRDPTLEFGSSHSSFCLALFFFSSSLSSLLRLKMQ